MKQYKTLKLFLLFTGCYILLSCKNTAYSTGKSGAQNFSARYNYLYNANELIKRLEESETADYNEDYDQILPVFRELPMQTILMNKVVLKANTIITEKNQSNYVDAAYLLLGKAYFYNRDYFSALANLDIIISEQKEKQDIYSQAVTLKIRCLLALGSNEEALSLVYNLNYNIDKYYKNVDDTYAAIAATYIANNQLKLAIPLLQSAASRTTDREERARWIYICGQLQEQQQEFAQAAINYGRVKNSNASNALKLNAALKEITLSDPAADKAGYEKSINRLLHNVNYEENRDQIFYQLGKNACLNKYYRISEKYYIKALQQKGKNLAIRGLSFSRIADLNLYQFHEYQKAENYYDSASTSLPKTLNHVDELERIDNLRTISSIYTTILKEDKPGKSVATLPYNQEVINGYYEIATIFLQKIKDQEESQRIYQELQRRFPGNSYSTLISRALKNIDPGNSENAFLAAYHNERFNTAIQEATDINRYRNTGLIAKKQIMPEEPSKNNVLAKTAETTKVALQKPAFPRTEIKPGSGPIDYYFIISINDVSINLSPARYRLGEFNRSRYADSRLRHKLLEFDSSQVIYVGIFKTMEEAKTYADEITPQLPVITQAPKGGYTSTIMSKENLEKLETLEILKQK